MKSAMFYRMAEKQGNKILGNTWFVYPPPLRSIPEEGRGGKEGFLFYFLLVGITVFPSRRRNGNEESNRIGLTKIYGGYRIYKDKYMTGD